MKKKKITLAKILWMKEKIHWKRTGQIFKKYDTVALRYTFGVFVAVLGICIHYAFVIMHTLFELMLFVFARKAFKANLQKMALKLVRV